MSGRTGQTLVDIRDATVIVLADRPELVMTYARLRTEGGPPLHAHNVRADTFVILGGEFAVGLGDERHELGAGSVWSAPPGASMATGTRAPTRSASSTCTRRHGLRRVPVPREDGGADRSVRAAADGRRPASDAALLKIHDGETVTDKPERRIRILVDLPELTLTWTRYVEGEEGPARTSTSSTWIPSSSIPRS